MENSGVSAWVPSRSLIESVAETISHRDRETMHLAVTQLLIEFLPARTVALYRFIAESNEQWLPLLDYGERDTLTQLLNRKTFESKFDKLRRRLAGAKRKPMRPPRPLNERTPRPIIRSTAAVTACATSRAWSRRRPAAHTPWG